MTVASWEQALDALEARLAEAERVAAAPGTVGDLGPFAAPAVPGPLPAGLAERARALVQRGEQIRRTCEEESARIRGELQHLARRAAPAREADSRFETRA